MIYGVGLAHFMMGEFEQAAEAVLKARKIDPGNKGWAALTAYSLIFAGRTDEAESFLTSRNMDTGIVGAIERKQQGIRRLVREEGVEHPIIPLLADELFFLLKRIGPPNIEYQIQALWKQERSRIQALLGTARVRLITIDKFPEDPKLTAETQRALADAIHARLVAGADFEKEAREHSDDRRKESGGLIPDLKEGVLAEHLEFPAFTLKPGEFTDVIERPAAYYILKVEERQPDTKASITDKKVRKMVEGLVIDGWMDEWQRNFLDKLSAELEAEASVGAR